MTGSLAERLRVLRARKGLTLAQAAERARITPDTLSDLEKGRRRAYTPTIHKIAAGYNVPVEELLEEPVPAGKDEAPEAGPENQPAPSDEERRHLIALFDSWAAEMSGLVETNKSWIDNLSRDVPPQTAHAIYQRVAQLFDDCTHVYRALENKGVMTRVMDAKGDAPSEVYLAANNLFKAWLELFYEVLPTARQWVDDQVKRTEFMQYAKQEETLARERLNNQGGVVIPIEVWQTQRGRIPEEPDMAAHMKSAG